MSRELYLYENAGVTARVLLSRSQKHSDLDVWISRKDLFHVDELADEWVQTEILPRCIHPGHTRTIYVRGPGFQHPPIHIQE